LTTTIDWVKAGKVIGVKDQGMCGSCYAFSSNLALESNIAIREGKDPVHLSEQEIVSCSSAYGNQGCNGGLEIFSWRYNQQNGAVAAKDYPYISGTTGKTETCERTTQASIAKATSWAQLTDGAAGIIRALKDGPVSVGIVGEN